MDAVAMEIRNDVLLNNTSTYYVQAVHSIRVQIMLKGQNLITRM